MVTFSKRPARLPLRYILIVTLIHLFYSSADALTRWSAVRLVPHADMIEGGAFVLDAHTYMFSDILDGTTLKPAGMVEFGISEWINIEAGYTGGFNLGLKARILGETKPFMPSLAIGARNFFSHQEAYYYGHAADTLDNEIYLVLGKSVDAVRLRFHVGLQSIPKNEQERFSPFAVIEKYFGMGLYVTAEVHRRAESFRPSLFIEWRFLKQHLELSAGMIDITGMFMNEGVPPGSPFFTSSDIQFVRPGIWAGLRFKGGFKFGKTEGFAGVETRLGAHSASIDALRSEVDSLKAMLLGSSKNMSEMSLSLKRITDSTLTEDQRFKALAVDRLAILKTLYDAEPFEPEAVKKAMAELTANRDRMLPALYEIVLDPVRENKIRTLAVTAIGEIGTPAAADVVIELLGQSPNPEMTIECLIALGKMKETRAVYLMQQLSNDPNDDVAFTAAEVLQKIEKETGVSAINVPVKLPPESIPEKAIGTTTAKDPAVKRPPPATKPVEPLKRPPPVASPKSDTGLQKVEKPEFTEATVAKEATPKPAIGQSPPAVVRPSEKQAPAPAAKSAEVKTNVPAPVQAAATAGEPTPKTETGAAIVPSSTGKKETIAGNPAPSPVSAKPVVAPVPPKPAKAEEMATSGRKRIDTSKETW